MKLNPNEPAYQRVIGIGYIGGLTIRAEIASRVLAGFAADHELTGDAAKFAEAACDWADALIAALNDEAQS